MRLGPITKALHREIRLRIMMRRAVRKTKAWFFFRGGLDRPNLLFLTRVRPPRAPASHQQVLLLLAAVAALAARPGEIEKELGAPPRPEKQSRPERTAARRLVYPRAARRSTTMTPFDATAPKTPPSQNKKQPTPPSGRSQGGTALLRPTTSSRRSPKRAAATPSKSRAPQE